MNSPARNVRAVVSKTPCCPSANKERHQCVALLPTFSLRYRVDFVQNHLPTDTQGGSVALPPSTCIKPSSMALLEMES